MQLIRASHEHLPSYMAALRAGWSADTVRGAVAAQEELQRIDADPDLFVASLYDPEAKGERIKLLDGSTAERLPGYRKFSSNVHDRAMEAAMTSAFVVFVVAFVWSQLAW